MNTFYIVLEVQNAGTPAVLTTAYTDQYQAESAYYHILSVAAVSTVPYHAAYIIRSDGVTTDAKVYDRRQSEQNVE